MNSDLWYLVGLIVGDGWLYKYRGSYSIGLETVYPSLAERFSAKMALVTGKTPYSRIRRDRHIIHLRLQSKLWYNTFLPLCESARNGTLKPDDPAAFLKGFFDAEGCVRNPHTKKEDITIGNKNLKLLGLAEKLLHNLGIETTGPYAQVRCHLLRIRSNSASTFKTVIGVDKPHKGITPRVA